MSATDVLRRLLDERGGFRVDFDREGARRTCWKIDDEQDGYCYFDEDAFGVTQFTVTRVTPEQAIAATLGTGTCHIDVRNGDWHCDACGEMVGTCDPASELFIDGNAIDMWKYCPFCGRRIEQ